MSPTIFRIRGYRFFFFSREETRMHVHIVSNDGEAKFWLEPNLEVAKSYKFSNKQLKEVELIIKNNQDEFISSWREHFGS